MTQKKSKASSNKQKFLSSKANVGLLLFLALSAGFLAGTRDDDILSTIGPLVGINKSSGTLDLSSIQDTYQYLDANYAGALDAQKLIEGANRGLVEAAGDDYTVYLDQATANEFRDSLNGDVGAGIGAQIGEINGQPTITRVIEDNPAKRSGVQNGDVITAVNGESADGWSAEKAANKIRGEEGTSVKLTVNRSGEERMFTITRATINNPSVYSEIQDGVGIMYITRFDEQTGALARQTAERFKQQDVKGVVVDLRGDGGGYLDAAVDVAGLWLDNEVVVTQRKDGNVIDTKRSSSNPVLQDIDTIVLVNGGTASASEILAASLKEYDEASIYGEQTFGKGSVQEVISLKNGALLKVTVARWFTPEGVNVSKTGITPDEVIELTEEQIGRGEDPQLDQTIKALQ